MLTDLKRRAKKIKREATALYFAYRDPRTPCFARIFCILVVSYMLSPIDLIPDFIPILGFVDDLVLVPLGITLALKMIPPPVMADARKSADDPQQSKGIVAMFTIFILCVWALAAFFLIQAIYRLVT